MPSPVPPRLRLLSDRRPRPLDGVPMPASVPAPILRQPRPSDEATLPAPVPLRLLVRDNPLIAAGMPDTPPLATARARLSPWRHRHVDRSTEPVCSIDCPAAPSVMGCSTPGPGGRTRSCRATISFCRSCNCALATRAASALSRHSFVLRADPRHLRREGCVQLLCERSGP